ncbi:ribonuclease h1 [Moniliophthora roreri]|uniref:Ribonuclease H n=1 Tax=Moniliophthora roreri TaxID=221103 RepID=A0A0W0FRY8_MONRR|nr:ribonuclease h1 [Moniliophthora roreri]
MAKPKGGFYAVHTGRIPGVYSTWAECEAQIKGFTNAKYKKFPSQEEAEEFLKVPKHPNLQGEQPSLSSTTTEIGKKRPLEDKAEADTPSPKKQKVVFEFDNSTDKDDDLVVYCDGASKGNGKQGAVAGVGVWWGPERCPGEQTNNRAELIAIARILETTPVNKKRRLLIKTDSQYSMDCFHNWIQKWRANGWKSASGGDVKNSALIRYIATLLEFRILFGQKVMLQKVKGHSGVEGNEGADYLANKGTLVTTHPPDRDWGEEERVYREKAEKLLNGAQEEHAGGDLEVVEEKDDVEDGSRGKVSVTVDSDALKAIHDNTAETAISTTPASRAPDKIESTVTEVDDLEGYAEAWTDDDDLLDEGDLEKDDAEDGSGGKASVTVDSDASKAIHDNAAETAVPTRAPDKVESVTEVDDLAGYAEAWANDDDLSNDLKD